MRTGLFRGVRCVAMAALWIGVTAGAAEAQGMIRGSVRERMGEWIGSAVVKAENSETGRVVTTRTNDGGRFALISLQGVTWILTIEAPGFYPVEAQVRVRNFAFRIVSFELMRDPTRPVAPSTGLLAGITAEDIQLELDTADTLYEAGQYDEAIEAYEAVLARIPFLTTINLQIGHAYREQKEYSKARAAYEEVLRSDPTNDKAMDALRMADLEENGQAAPRQP